MSDTHPDPGDNLILFPTPAGAQGHSAPVVLDGELLTEQDNPAVVGPLAGLVVWVVMLARGVGTSPQVVQARAVVGYRLRKAPRDAVRLGWFFLRGHSRWIAKAWTWVSHGHLRADARAAWLAGDSEARRKAQELIRADARARWAKLGIAAHRVLAGALLVTFLGGVLALIDSQVSRADMWPWLAGVYTVLGVLGAVALWVLKALPVGWLIAASWEGRDKTPGAGWLVRPTRDDADSWIDERMISQALAHLGISPLDRFSRPGVSWSTRCPRGWTGRAPTRRSGCRWGPPRTWSPPNAPPWPRTWAAPPWRPGPPRARRPGSWSCGSPIRANSAAALGPGRCWTRAVWMSSKACRSARPNAGS
jgi:hypothetical protein